MFYKFFIEMEFRMMKKWTSLVLLAIALVFAACSSDDNPTSSNPNDYVLGTLKASVNGKSWQSMQAMAVRVQGVNITVSGANISGESISITFSDTDPGSYFSGLGFYNIVDMQNPTDQKVYASTDAEYEIISFEDNVITGKFSFTGDLQNGEGTATITNGTFKVQLL